VMVMASSLPKVDGAVPLGCAAWSVVAAWWATPR